MDVRNNTEVAVKTVRQKSLVESEVQALQEAKRVGVSRVVDLLDCIDAPFGRTHLILEYVDLLFVLTCNSLLKFTACCRCVKGFTLQQYMKWRVLSAIDTDFESNMVTIAVQLMEASHPLQYTIYMCRP